MTRAEFLHACKMLPQCLAASLVVDTIFDSTGPDSRLAASAAARNSCNSQEPRMPAQAVSGPCHCVGCLCHFGNLSHHVRRSFMASYLHVGPESAYCPGRVATAKRSAPETSWTNLPSVKWVKQASRPSNSSSTSSSNRSNDSRSNIYIYIYSFLYQW